MNRFQDNLKSLTSGTKLVLRPSHTPRPGEIRVKLSLLEIDEPEFFKPVLDSIVAKGMTVREFKEQLVKEAYEQGVDVQLTPDR